MEPVKNYYGNLCTEMYEILHKDAPLDELSFYLSYAEKGMNILEPLCGSGRFLIPFFMEMCRAILYKMKCLLKKDGKFVFAVDTVTNRCPDDSDYHILISVKTKEGFDLVLKGKNFYDEKTHTQFSPSIYELYNGTELLQQEEMNFQTHLYELGEMESYLRDIGFTKIRVYSSYDKVVAENNQSKMFLYECSV